MRHDQFVPFKKIGTDISPKVTGDSLENMPIGETTPAAGSFTDVKSETVTLKEITTPTPLADYGKVYTKADNVLYFQCGAGVEHAITVIGDAYAEAYIYNNAIDTVIETADIPIALRQISEGLTANFVFDVGSTGAITSYQIGTGGASFTRINDVDHGLSNGDVITVRGSTVAAYNGVQTVSSVSTDYFDIDTAWDVDGGASDWDQGASLKANGRSAGIYSASWQMSTGPDAACNLIWMMYVNATPQTKSTAERKYPINDLGSCSSSCVLDISDGDVIWLSVQSDDTANILNKHGEFNLRRL